MLRCLGVVKASLLFVSGRKYGGSVVYDLVLGLRVLREYAPPPFMPARGISPFNGVVFAQPVLNWS